MGLTIATPPSKYESLWVTVFQHATASGRGVKEATECADEAVIAYQRRCKVQHEGSIGVGLSLAVALKFYTREYLRNKHVVLMGTTETVVTGRIKDFSNQGFSMHGEHMEPKVLIRIDDTDATTEDDKLHDWLPVSSIHLIGQYPEF